MLKQTQLTPVFTSYIGVRQGDNLSPSLFNICINDKIIPNKLMGCAPAKLNEIPIQCLLYADDLIILSENIEGMQKALDNLLHYCDKWKLNINTDKTKIICMNRAKKDKLAQYNNTNIEVVSEYCYLGIIFSEKCTFKAAIENLYNKGLKSYFKLIKILDPLPSAKTSLHLFDHLIKPILLYGCEIWGPCHLKPPQPPKEDNYWKTLENNFFLEHKMAKTINPYEKLHIKMCRNILGVNNKTSVIGIYGELGRYPL